MDPGVAAGFAGSVGAVEGTSGDADGDEDGWNDA